MKFPKVLLFFCLISPLHSVFGGDLPLLQINTFRKVIKKRSEINATLTLEGQNFPILIRRRGKTSDGFRKKQYQFKFVNQDKKSIKKSIFNFKMGKKWILNGPYIDKTLMRNPLAYAVAKDLKNSKGGPWYSPSTLYVELKINNRYRGIYILMDKIARGKSRVSIKKFKNGNEEFIAEIHGETFGVKADFISQQNTPLQFFQPSRKDLGESGAKGVRVRLRIKKIIDDFERKLNRAERLEDLKGLINVTSFANYFLIQEIFKNLDGFRRSAYFFYKNGMIHMGPVWDFNISMGNFVFYKKIMSPTGFMYPKEKYFDGNHNVFWFKKLMSLKGFREKVRNLYREERKIGGAFHLRSFRGHIANFLNQLGSGSIYRNFKKWKLIGRPFTPLFYNPRPRPKTYRGEILKMEKWLRRRLNWIDANL